MGDARVILQSATMNFNPFRSTSSVVSSNSPQSPRSQPLPLQFSASRSTQVVRDCHGNYDLEDTTRVASNSGTSTSISTGSVTAAVATNATIASPSRSPGPMAPLSAPLAWLSGWGATSFSSSSAGKQNHSHHQFSTNSYASQNHGGGHPLNITDNHQKPASSSQRAALTPTTIGTTTSPRSALPPPPIMHSIDSSHPNPNPSAAGPNLNNAAFTSPPPRASMITNNVNNRAPIPTSLTMLRGTESHESDDEENRLQNLINNSFDDDRGTTMPSITSMMSAVILGPEKTMKKQQQQRQEKMAREGISRVERVDVDGGEIVNNFQNSTYSQHHYNHQLRQPQLQTGHNRQMHPQQHSMAVAISTDKLNSIAPDSGNIEDRAETQYAADENHPKPIGSSSKNADTKAADSVSSVSPIHPRHHQQQQTNHKQHHYPKESNTTFPGFALFEMAKVQYCLGKYSKALDTTTECLAFQKLALERMEKNSSSTGNIGSDNFSAISNEFAQIGSAHGANSGISGLHASASAYVSANWSASGGMPHPDNRYCSTMTPNPNHHPSSRISSLGGTNAKVTTTIGRDVSHDGFGSSVRNLGMGVVRSLKGSGSGSFYGSAGSSSIAVGNSANGTAGTVGGSGNSANVGTVVGVAGGTSSLPMASRAPLPSVTINKNASDIRINHPLPHSIMANTTTMMISHYPTHSCIAQTLLLRGRVLAECGVYGCHDDDEDGSGNASGGNGGGGGGDTDFLLLLQAIRHVEMAVAIQRRITIESNANEDLSRWQLTTPLVFLGVMRAQLANFEEADMAYEEALSILRSVKKREREDLLAAKRRGDVESVKECESCIRQIDSEIAHVLCLLGRSHHCRRSYEKAFDCYNRGLRLHKRVGSTKKNGSVRGIRRCMKDKGALEKLVSGYWDDRSTI